MLSPCPQPCDTGEPGHSTPSFLPPAPHPSLTSAGRDPRLGGFGDTRPQPCGGLVSCMSLSPLSPCVTCEGSPQRCPCDPCVTVCPCPVWDPGCDVPVPTVALSPHIPVPTVFLGLSPWCPSVLHHNGSCVCHVALSPQCPCPQCSCPHMSVSPQCPCPRSVPVPHNGLVPHSVPVPTVSLCPTRPSVLNILMPRALSPCPQPL